MKPIFKRGGFLEPLFAALRVSRPSTTGTEGVGGTAVYGGWVDQKETDPKLVGTERYRTFSNILANVSVVSAGVRLYLNLVGKAQWKVEPAVGDDIDEDEAAEFAQRVERILFKEMTTPWARVVRRAAMYRFYGFSVQEWTGVRLEGGDIGFLDVEPRPQLTIERWDLDETGTVFGMVQRSPQTATEYYLPRSKLLYLVDDSINDSPEGLGLFRHVVESARRLRRYEQLEGYGFESDLRGVPVGRAPLAEMDKQIAAGTLTELQKTNYVNGMKTFLEKHIKNPELGLLMDSATYETSDEKRAPSGSLQWDLQLLTGDSSSHDAVANAIERVNREIARVLGVEGILLGERGGGSLALSKTKSDTLAQVVDSALDEIAESVQADLVARLFEVNGWDPNLAPTIKTEALQHREITDITAALQQLSNSAGAIGPEDEAFMEIFDLLGLTRPQIDALRIARDEALLMAGGQPGGPNIPPRPGAEVQPTEDEPTDPAGGKPVPATEED